MAILDDIITQLNTPKEEEKKPVDEGKPSSDKDTGSKGRKEADINSAVYSDEWRDFISK